MVHCPAELYVPLPANPRPAADAKVEPNDTGAAWLKAFTAYAAELLGVLTSARQACTTAEAP